MKKLVNSQTEDVLGREPLRKIWNFISNPREAVSAYTHFLGAVLSIPALFLLIRSVPSGSRVGIYVSLIVFGISMFLLYTTSGFYHFVNASQKVLQVLRRLDHIMIYILIAGTYTPLCMIFLSGTWRWGILISIWALALAGLVFKLLWFKAPRWVSTLTYIFMGWLVVVAFVPLCGSLAIPGILWLVGGGVLYSVGAVIYATKWPRLNFNFFGFHEIFHLFVMAGSFSHFWLFFQYA